MKYNFVVALYAMQVPLYQVMVGFHKIAIRIPINDLPDMTCFEMCLDWICGEELEVF